MRLAGQEPFPVIYVDSKTEGEVGASNPPYTCIKPLPLV